MKFLKKFTSDTSCNEYITAFRNEFKITKPFLGLTKYDSTKKITYKRKIKPSFSKAFESHSFSTPL